MAGRRQHFGSVRKLPSGRWQASYWHDGVRHVADTTFRAKSDAQAWLSGTETAIHGGEWSDPASGRMTVEDLANRWTASNPAKRRSTRARDETILRLHVVPTAPPSLRHARIRSVTPPDVQALVNEWTLHQAPRTVRRQYGVLRAVFAYAVASDWLTRTPCRGIKLPAVAELRRAPVGAEQVVAVAGAMDIAYRPMVYLGAVLGLRWGEVAGIRVAALDLLRGTLQVREQLGRDGKTGPPKSAAGRRTMSLPVPLVELLADHLARRGLTAAEPEALVFAAPAGGPLDYSHWRRRVWGPACEAAGVPAAVFHDLRRANATTLVAQGVDLKTAQTRLGHSDPRLTLAVYAQATSAADREAAERLGSVFFGTPSAVSTESDRSTHP